MRKGILLFALLICACACTYAQNLISMQNDKGKYGFVDETGSFIIEPQYDGICFEFTEGVACVEVKGKLSFINEQGKKLSKKTYMWADYFDDNGLCMVNAGGKKDDNDGVLGGKFGYVDRTGKEVVPVQYNQTGRFNGNGIAIVNIGGSYDKEGDFEGGKYGFVNLLGKELIKPRYAQIGQYDDDGIAWANIGGKIDKKTGEFSGGVYGYVNDNGMEIFKPKYTYVGPFVDGYCWINKGAKAWKPNNKKKVSPDKEDVRHNPIAGGKYGFVNFSGREIVKPKYARTADRFTEDRAWVQSGKKYGYIDNTGREITKVIYNNVASEYYNKMAWVLQKDGYGFVNHYGMEVTGQSYQDVGYFESGFTWVKAFPGKKSKTPAKYGLIDADGRAIAPMKYDMVQPRVSDGIIGCLYDGGWCYVNEKGEEITPNRFIEVSYFKDGVAWAKIKNEDTDKYERLISENQSQQSIRTPKAITKILNSKAATKSKTMPVKKSKSAGDKDYDDLLKVANQDKIAKKMADRYMAKLERDVDYQKLKAMGANFKIDTATTTGRYMKSIELPDKTLPNLPGKYGLLDKSGKAITEFEFNYVSDFSEGLAAVESSTTKKVGYVNSQGEEVIPFDYTGGFNFRNGIAAARKDNKWGYIDKSGNEHMPFSYENVELEFRSDITAVQLNGKWGGINTNGELMVPTVLGEYQDIDYIRKGFDFSAHVKPLSGRQVKLYSIYSNDKRNSYSINEVIPDEIWDF